jgi:hypothetical protein
MNLHATNNQKMTVKDLIKFLEAQPQDILVAFKLFSEQRLLELRDIEIVEACEPRPDGWVQRKRPDMPKQTYLLLPGN